jgi:hypothetical protein
VIDGEEIILMDYAGEIIASGTGYSDIRSSPNRVSVWFSDTIAVIGDRGPTAAPGPAGYGDVYSSADRGSLLLTMPVGDAATRSLLQLDPFTGRATVLAEAPPPLGVAPEGVPDPAGYWAWGIPSEQGGAVLGQWIGECEIPTAFVIETSGEMSAVGVTGDDWSEAPGSFAAGWTPEGRPIIGLWSGGCGPEATPGVFLADGDELTPIYLSDTDGPEAFVWLRDPLSGADDPYFNRREERLIATYRSMGVRGGGEPSHGGNGAWVGFDWAGGFIGVLAIDIGWVLDQIAEPAIDTYTVGTNTVGVFPVWDGRAGSETHVFFCGDTGFVLEGDIVRSGVEAFIEALNCA